MAQKKKKKKRVYKKGLPGSEYDKHHSSETAKGHRAARNKARRESIRSGLVKKGDNNEIDHEIPLSKGGSNGKSNRRVVSRSTNRKKGTKTT